MLFVRGYLHCENATMVPKNFTKIGENLWVDKNVTYAISKDQSVALIGFSVDVRTPRMNMQDQAENLAEALATSETAFSYRMRLYLWQICNNF